MGIQASLARTPSRFATRGAGVLAPPAPEARERAYLDTFNRVSEVRRLMARSLSTPPKKPETRVSA